MKIRRGAAIVEVMIAVAVATISLLALVQLANKSVNTTGVAKRVTDARDLAARAMEQVKDDKANSGWSEFRTAHASGVGCFDGTGLSGSSSCAVSGTVYTSAITYVFLTAGATEQVTVTVAITWTDGAIDKNATLQTVLTKY